MTPDCLRYPISPRFKATTLTHRNRWIITHRSLDLFLLAGSACLVVLMSQPLAAALVQN